MSADVPSLLLDPDLASALAAKGYATLTEVQQKVLDPALAQRDLRISSQTGSGKTLAIGFAVREVVTESVQSADRIARPSVLVITPTRELAKQVEVELAWLFRPRKAQVMSVTGGSSVRDEFRALARGPSILVGTPGRLLDHLKRGAIDLGQTGAVVLDEADRMLDLGFRDDLEAILALAGADHRTHLVSATFPREVEALAQRVQKDAVRVQGTPLGSANADIDHMIHLVKTGERVDALINLLLASPGEQVLAFARTRADVARVCEELDEAGFAVDSLSGEMEQTARLRALGAFKAGKLQVLVATDVAARGIDHQDIARVVQLEPPNDADTYTHRSGRTGRAGRKGKSSIMVQPAGVQRLSGLLKRAGVKVRFEPIPTAETIRAAQDERLLAELAGEATPGEAGTEPERAVDPHAAELAARLMATGRAERALAHLIERTREAGTCAPREVTPLTPGPSRQQGAPTTGPRPGRARETLRGGRPHDLPRNGRPHEPPRGMRTNDVSRGMRPNDSSRGARPNDFSRGMRTNDFSSAARPNDFSRGARPGDFSRERDAQAPREQARTEHEDGGWVRFHVSWGEAQGADARRLLPMLCRRGNIRGSDIGAIKLAPSFSLVDVSMHVAADFERAARRPDPRDPAVVVRREGGSFGPADGGSFGPADGGSFGPGARPRGRNRPS